MEALSSHSGSFYMFLRNSTQAVPYIYNFDAAGEGLEPPFIAFSSGGGNISLRVSM